VVFLFPISAVKQANELLFKMPGLSTHERELIKAIPETELTEAMLGNVRLVAAGIQATKQTNKKSKKDKAKKSK
jgi:hypothetical protein